MEYLILFLVVLGCVAIVADAKKWDEQDHFDRIRKSVNNDYMVFAKTNWEYEGTRREW